MPLKLITGPVTEPLTLDEAKAHLRVDGSDDDAYIGALIIAARDLAEKQTNRQLLPATYELALDAFEYEIKLPKAPFKELLSIKYIDPEGVEQTLAADGYSLDDYSEPARIIIKDLPEVKDTPNAVKVRFIAGYNLTATVINQVTTYTNEVPEPIKSAMKLIIGHLEQNRQDVVTGTIASKIPNASESILGVYRVYA